MTEEHYDVLVGNLCALYAAAVPSEIESDGSLDDWDVFGAAMLARCHYLLESITALRARQVDAAVLVRSLYEHVVTFAWIAAEPTAHLPRFLAYEAEERRKALDELVKYGNPKPRWGEGLEEFKKRYVPAGTKLAPAVPERASEADAKWSAFVTEKLGDGYGFRGMYTVFRHTSTFVHPTTTGVHQFIHRSGSVVKVGRPHPLDHSPGHLAPVLFGLALLVASECFLRPEREHVFRAFELAAQGVHLHATRSQ